MPLIVKKCSLVTVVGFIILLETELCTAECNLAKIFRTPRDFDHLEIVERAGFDRTDSTTIPPSTAKSTGEYTRKNGNNHASAHVSLRFGPDYGSHVMKVPPQVGNLIDNGINHFPDPMLNPNFIYPPPRPYRTPPPCPSHQYFHPYPPPVPYIFPNYYFWSPEQESTYLPPQLNEYFRRHPDFVVARYPHQQEVFVGGRPVRREEAGEHFIPANFLNGPVELPENLNLLQNNLPMALKPIQMIHSRMLRPIDPTSDAVKENNEKTKEVKRDCTSQQENNDNGTKNSISMVFLDSFEESPYEKYDQNQTTENTELDVLKSKKLDVEKQIDDSSNLTIPESIIADVEKEMDDLISELEVSRADSQDARKEVVHSQEPVTEELKDDLQKLLNESLIEYNSENDTIPPKMLISYPIFNRELLNQAIVQASSRLNFTISQEEKLANDIDNLKLLKTDDIVNDGTYKKNQDSNSTTNPLTGKGNFINDIDDLVAVMIQIIDLPLTLVPKPMVPEYSSVSSGIMPPVAKPYSPSEDPLLYPDVISPFSSLLPKAASPPLSSILNLLSYYGLLNTHPNSLTPQMAYSTSNQYKEYYSPSPQTTQLGYSSRPVSDPKSIVVYHSSPQVKVLDQRIPNTGTKVATTLQEICLPAKTESTCKTTYIIPIMEEAKTATFGSPLNLINRLSDEDLPATYMSQINPMTRSVPEANGLVTDGDTMMPEYFRLITRSYDLEDELPTEDDAFSAIISSSNIPDHIVGASDPESDYCKKCGHKHSGGSYCDKCGYPVIFNRSNMNSYCPSCTQETRQLNDG